MDEQITTPDGAATPVAPESPPKVEQPRGPDGKFESQAPPAAEAGAPTDAQPSDDPAPPKEPTTERPDEPRRNRVSERIDRLTADKHAALREAASLRARLAALQQVEPARVDPNDYDAVQRETLRGVIREEQHGQTRQQIADAEAKVQTATAQMFWEKVNGARERIPNLDQSLNQFAQIRLSDDVCSLIAESDFAPEIAHYMAQPANAREVADLQYMTPAQQGRALARIEAKFNLPSKRTSNAPPPPPTVTGAQVARAKTPAEESALEYMTRRQAEWRKGAR